MTYQSRYQQRRQTVVTGKVQSVERYDRFYDIVFEAIEHGRLPTIQLPAGQILLRKSQRDIEQSRTIPPTSYSTMSLANRYSGRRLDGKPGQGALYVGTIAGILREHTHYALSGKASPTPVYRPGTSADATKRFIDTEKAGVTPKAGIAGRPFHAYRLLRAMTFADFRLPSLTRLFAMVRATPDASRRFGIVDWSPVDFQIVAVNAAVDYSAARGMADAVYDAGTARGLRGVCAISARADSDLGIVLGSHGDLTSGLVFAIFGPPGARVDALQPINSFSTFKDLSDALQKMQGFAVL